MTGVITRGKANRADLAHWDGKTITHSRIDATGGTVTGLSVDNEVDVLQVFGSGTDRTRATIADAVNHIASTAVRLVFAPGTWEIDADLTIGANFTCHFPAGAVLTPASGVTVTINGPVVADRYRIFNTDDGSIAGLKHSYPEWFNAKADGSTDDAGAIGDAISATSGGLVDFGKGVYIAGINTAADVFTLASGTTIKGAGIDVTEIRTTGTPASDRTLFVVTAANNATVSDLKITGPSSDGAGNSKGVRHAGTSGRLTVRNVWLHQWQDGVKKDSGASCEIFVHGCRFTSIRGQGILDAQSSGRLIVTDSVFDTIGTSNLHHGIYHQAPFTELIVANCSFRSITGYGINRFSTTGSGNGLVSITGCSFSANTTGDIIIDDVSGTVDLSATISGCSFGSATGVFIWAGNVTITGSTFRNSTKCIDTTGAVTTGENVTVTGNQFRFSGALGIEVTIAGCNGWTISGNTFLQGGSGATDVAIRIDNGTDFNIVGNTFVMNNGQPMRCRTASNRVFFTQNHVSGTTNSTGVYIQASASDPGVFVVSNNHLAQTDRGVTCEVAGLRLEHNRIAASSPVSISSGKSARIVGNEGYLEGSASYDPGSLADGAGATTTVSVAGAALGDYAYASFSLDLQGITVTAWVSAANTASVRFQNESTGTLDLSSGTLKVYAERR